MKVSRMRIVGATFGLVAATGLVSTAYASTPSGLTPTTLATASLASPVHVNEDGVKFMTKTATDVRVQQFAFAAGSSSGWHHHPGMVIVVVASGSVTVWNEHCKSTTYGPGLPHGAAFVESGNEPGQVTSQHGATTYVTYVAPKANPAVFRVEDKAPRCAARAH